ARARRQCRGPRAGARPCPGAVRRSCPWRAPSVSKPMIGRNPLRGKPFSARQERRPNQDAGMPERERALRDFGRAGGGALLFSLPMLMTMEFWSLGITLDRGRLLVLLALNLPLLVLLSRQIGFEESGGWADDILDTLIALGIGLVASAAILALFGSLSLDEPLDAAAGKITLQTVPA